MKKNTFNNNKAVELKLFNLSKLHKIDFYERFYPMDKERELIKQKKDIELHEKLKFGLIPAYIEKGTDSKKELSDSQSRAIAFIIGNENSIIEQIYRLLKRTYPKIIEEKLRSGKLEDIFEDGILLARWDEFLDDYRYPPLGDINNLSTILGVEHINIKSAQKEKFSYTTFHFRAVFDENIDGALLYGFHVLMHKDLVVDWGKNYSFKIE